MTVRILHLVLPGLVLLSHVRLTPGLQLGSVPLLDCGAMGLRRACYRY